MLQTITNPYTIDKLNKNLAFCATYKKKKLVDLSYYARDNIPNYDTITEIPQEHLDYLQSGLHASNMKGMFYGCTQLTTIPKLNIDTSNVTNMSYMFYYCSSLTSLDLSNFDTSKVEDMSNMFYECKSLTSLDLSNFDTSKVTNMRNMFENCSVSGNLYLKNLTIIEACKYAGMFININISGTLEIGVKYIYGDDFSIFASESNLYECENKIHINLDLENQTNIGLLDSLSSSKELKVSNTSNSSLTSMRYLFSSMNLKSLDLSNFNTSKITNMVYLFTNSEILSINGLSNFDTKNITDMEGMFENFKSYSLDLSNWNTENVISAFMMFKDSELTILHIFSTENIQDMGYMFLDSNILTIDGIISMKSCKNYQGMFNNNSLTEKVYLTNVPEDFDPGLAGLMEGQYEIVS